MSETYDVTTHSYEVKLILETNTIKEGDPETVRNSVLKDVAAIIEQIGAEEALEGCEVEYKGVDVKTYTEDEMDKMLIPADAVAMLQMMLENGLIELPEEEESDGNDKQ